MHGDQWPKVGATLALMWLKRFDKLYVNCLVYLLHLTTLNYPILSPLEVWDSFRSSSKASPMVKRTRATPTWFESTSPKPTKWPWNDTTAGLFNSSSRSVQGFIVTVWTWHQCLCFLFRWLFSALLTSLISWGPSPRVGRSRKRTAWRKSENSFLISLRRLTPFMRCTARWTPTLTTEREVAMLSPA